MDISTILKYTQIGFSIVLSILVLMQNSGGGLTAGLNNVSGFYRSRRGFEKFLFTSTIIISILFVINSVLVIIY